MKTLSAEEFCDLAECGKLAAVFADDPVIGLTLNGELIAQAHAPEHPIDDGSPAGQPQEEKK